MARNQKGPQLRDVDAEDKETYLTKSRAELDLERRSDEDYHPESEVGSTVTMNPNPFGEGDYVGTDPVYQNYSTDANKPFASEEGVEADLLEAYKEEHEVEDGDAVQDPGLGGVARKAQAGTGGRTFRTVLPGQEGYDLKEAEEQNGPPLRVYHDEDSDESDDEVTEISVPGTNMGATTEDPENPDDPSEQSGNRTGDE